MFNYFYDFIDGFFDMGNTVINTCVAQLLCVCLCICVIYLLTKIVFPKDSTVKKVVFCFLFVFAMLVVLYANGINLITITQTLAQLGGV